MCSTFSGTDTTHVSIHTSVHTHSWLHTAPDDQQGECWGTEECCFAHYKESHHGMQECLHTCTYKCDVCVPTALRNFGCQHLCTSLLPPFTHAHTQMHTSTHTHTHYTHLSSKSWVSMAKESAQKLSLEVSVPFVTVRLRKGGEGRGRGGTACSACDIRVLTESIFSSSFDRKGTWWNQGKSMILCCRFHDGCIVSLVLPSLYDHNIKLVNLVTHTHTGSQPLCHSARPKACSKYFQCTAASEEPPTKSCHFSSTQECTTTLWDEQGRTFMVRKQL